MDRAVKTHKRKEKRKNKVEIKNDFMPIDMIHDP